MNITQARQEIRDITMILLRAGMIDHQNPASMTTVAGSARIGIAGSPDLSISMRDTSYETIYELLFAAGAYHLRMIDGALIQMLYCFDRRSLKDHRLCYFPSPALQSYDEAAQLYDDVELFADIFEVNAIRAPLRFDYSSSVNEHVDVDHPKCHLTIGQIKGCRIPLDGPLTPMRFMRFILRNFYNPAYASVDIDRRALSHQFHQSISVDEKSILHVNG